MSFKGLSITLIYAIILCGETLNHPEESRMSYVNVIRKQLRMTNIFKE